jgi:hypothetical protein
MSEMIEKKISTALAPEDVKVGDYVGILHVITEFPRAFLCGDQTWESPSELVRWQWMAPPGEPMKVVEVSLPFVLVRQADGKHRTLDMRRHRLARVSERFGRKAFKRFRRDHSDPLGL